MSIRHPFLDGRRVFAIAPLAVGTYALAYVFWYGSIDRGRCGIGVVEHCPVARFLVLGQAQKEFKDGLSDGMEDDETPKDA